MAKIMNKEATPESSWGIDLFRGLVSNPPQKALSVFFDGWSYACYCSLRINKTLMESSTCCLNYEK